MKTLLRVFGVTTFLTVFGIISASAQEEKCPDLAACFEIFKAERTKPCGDRAKAIEIGTYIGEKFKDDVDNAELVKRIATLTETYKEGDRVCIRNRDWDKAYKDKTWDRFFSLSKEIINDPKTDRGVGLDVTLTMVGTGFDLASSKNDAFLNDTVTYAKTAIQNIEGGLVSKNGKWGYFVPFNTKDETLSWLSYTVAFIYDARMGATMPARREESIPYYYKSAQFMPKKSDPFVFQRIAGWYIVKATALYTEYETIFEANSKVDTDEARAKVAEANAKLALARGYADRALDSFGRAQKLAMDPKYADAKFKDFKTAINDKLTEFYKFRFNGKTEGQDKYIAEIIARPMPDPTSTVTPVIVTETAVTPTTTPTTTTTKPATTVPATKPTTPVAKPATPAASSTVKPAATSTSKTPAKKPAPKKKGTR